MTRDLLRLVTAGSVDDGKSTVVGRLLYDTKSVLGDQIDAVRRASVQRGLDTPDLALLVDGLRAEREQGITIDVAYRYFSTARRTFVLADTPGHVQYTRNTVTGASTADHAVLLCDAGKGMLPQTRRHLAVMAMLDVPGLTLAVNKMDLVDFAEDVFLEIRDAFVRQALDLGYAADRVLAVPVSALTGDNVVTASPRTPWYDGPTLLERLESVEVDRAADEGAFRMPVQYVLRDQRDGYRGYAGQVAAGSVRAGDEVVVLPDGVRTVVEQIDSPDGGVPVAARGSAVSLVLRDQVDIGRGDLIASVARPPEVTDQLDATVCWLGDTPLEAGARLLLKHGTRTTAAQVTELISRFDEQRLSVVARPSALNLNDTGRVRVQVAKGLPVDGYTECRTTGTFILINRSDGNTVGAGLIGDPMSAFVGMATPSHSPSR
ncbi:GTP-binding protein [Streptomyces spectabilis]|uniref:sulfate adenylyltransferase subunit 1 n=1 Tax=Streptomyces spectabilis TaxID=68270 RepID=UPI0033C0A034